MKLKKIGERFKAGLRAFVTFRWPRYTEPTIAGMVLCLCGAAGVIIGLLLLTAFSQRWGWVFYAPGYYFIIWVCTNEIRKKQAKRRRR